MNYLTGKIGTLVISAVTMLISIVATLYFSAPDQLRNFAGEMIQDFYDPSFHIPAEIGQKRKANIAVRVKNMELPSLSARVTAGKEYEQITGQEIHRYLRELTEFSQKSKKDGNILWGRLQGSKYEYEATKYVADHFRRWGLQDVNIERAPISKPVWRPSAIELIVRGSGLTGDVRLNTAMTAFPSGVTAPEGLSAPIVYVGLGTRADLRGKDIKGKIALLYVRVWEGVLMHSGHLAALRLVKQYGAAGVILWLDLPGNNKFAAQLFSPEGFLTQVPWTNIGYEDGLYLRKRIERSPIDDPPVVNLKVVAKMRGDLKSQNLFGVLPGRDTRTIMITAHIDGFFNAALDNGTGVSALMALAHYYSKIPRSQRPYNLLFLVTGDHEQSGSAGILNFVKNHPDMMARTKLIIQLEHMASAGIVKELNVATRTNSETSRMLMVTNLSPWLIKHFTRAAADYGIVMNQGIFQEYAGDVEGLSKSGIPAAGWIEAGFFYHNEADSPDNISPAALQNMTRAYASVIGEIGRAGIEQVSKNGKKSPPPIYDSKELLFFLSQW